MITLHKRYRLVGILFLTLLIAYADRVTVSILIADPRFLAELGLQDRPVLLGSLMTVFLLFYALSNIIFSPLGDIWGPRKAMTVATGLWAPAMALGGLAPSLTVLLAARAFLGLAEGLHWPAQSKFVTNWFGPPERGKANAVWLLGLILGPAISLPVLVALIQTYGWRISFFFLALLSLVPMGLLLAFTTDYPDRDEDFTRAGEVAAATTAARSSGEKWSESKEHIKTFAVSPRFWALTVFSFCHASMWWGTIAWVPAYLKSAQGFSWQNTGLWASLPYFVGAVAALGAGYWSDRLNRRAPFAALSLLGSAVSILAALSSRGLIAVVYIGASITALSLGLPVIWAMLQRLVPAGAAGAGAGLMNGLTNGGAALAPVLVGLCIAIAGGFSGGLLFLAGLGLLGCLCLIPLRRE